ncbi:TorF family putative porin [Microbacteriaceae bacterium K1510]|nr:TorF family putative porin [Microbacteriaceae bacterium K1510]
MKKIVLSVLAACAVSAAAPAFAADMPVKAVKAPAVVAPSPWDIAFGGAVMSDYMWRGITQSGHKPSVAAYFEPRYNITPNLQLYAGISGESIKFANNAAAEIDFYGGIRPTFGPLAFDVGVWYYYYPGGNSTYSLNGVISPVIANASFYEVYGKVAWTATDWLTLGAYVQYTPSYLNTGAKGTYYAGTVKLTAPSTWLPNDIGAYVSGEVGRQALTSTKIDNWVYFASLDLPDYTTWNVGLGFTWKVFTLDLRYSGTDLSKENCFILTGDPGAGFGGSTSALNPAGNTSKWCGDTFIAKLSADLTLGSLK